MIWFPGFPAADPRARGQGLTPAEGGSAVVDADWRTRQLTPPKVQSVKEAVWWLTLAEGSFVVVDAGWRTRRLTPSGGGSAVVDAGWRIKRFMLAEEGRVVVDVSWRTSRG